VLNLTTLPLQPTTTPTRESAKIERSAKDFESLLLSGWLQQAEESFAKLPGGDDEDDADAGTSQMQGIAMQSLGNSLTESGGIGIARMIAKNLHKTEEPVASTANALTLNPTLALPTKF
jgi:Rod binding domain-containing protein